MQSIFRLVSAILCLCVCFVGGQAANAQDDIPVIDWQKRLTVSDRLTAFGEDLMGDSVDPHIGSLVFEQTDINLPGNSGLDVSLRRRLTQGYKYKEGVNVEFGDWSLVVPRITAIASQQKGWAGNRCSGSWNQNFPTVTWAQNVNSGNPSYGLIYGRDYSDGVSMDIPGQGSQAILKNGGTISTVGEWKFTCTTASDGKQGFIGHAPNGDKYYFNKAITRPYKRMGLAKVSASNIPRVKVILAATEVRDVNGNLVEYFYDSSDRLTRIEANDGRKITLAYSGTLISSASANGRVWQYSYRNSTYYQPEWSIGRQGIFSGKVLSRVTQPDNRFWSFELDAMQAEPSPASRTCERASHIMNLTHPYGVKGTFRIRDIEHRQAYKSYTAVVNNCFESFLAEPDAPAPGPSGGIPTPFQVLTSRVMAVTSKVLSGPSIPTAGWSFFYEQDNECAGLPANICAEYGATTGGSGGGEGGGGSGGGGGGQGEEGPPLPEGEPACTAVGCQGDYLLPGVPVPGILGGLPINNNQSNGSATLNCEFCYGTIHNVAQYVEPSPSHIYLTQTNPTHSSDAAYAGTSPFNFTNWTRVQNPDGSIITYHHLWSFEEGFGGKEIRRTISSSSGVLQTQNFTYAQHGCKGSVSVKTGANYKPGYCPTHITKTVTERDGDTYTSEAAYNLNPSASNYSYGRPIQTKRYSNVSTSPRITNTTYEHNTSKWVLGLPKTVKRTDGLEVARYTYDSLGRKTSQTRYGQPYKSYTYHGAGASGGALFQVFDALNRRTELRAWKRGTPQQIKRPDNVSEYQFVDNNGWLTSSKDAMNRTTSYARDNMGRLTRINPTGNYWANTDISYNFSGIGATQTITKGQGKTTITYDNMFRPTLERTQALDTGWSSYVNTKYDGLGRTIFTSQPSTSSVESKGVDYTYDGLGRPLTERENVSPYALTRHTYNSSHAHSVVDPSGAFTRYYGYGYDGPGNTNYRAIYKYANGAWQQKTYIYKNVDGEMYRLKQWGDMNGYSVNKSQYFYYDAQRRVCRHYVPEHGATKYQYDAAGQMIASAKGQGNSGCGAVPNVSAKVSQSYDNLGRPTVTNFTDPATADISRTYDANGNVKTVNRGGVNWTYNYNDLDMLWEQILTIDGRTYRIADDFNNPTALRTARRNPSGKLIRFSPDALNRPTHVQAGEGGSTQTLANGMNYHASGALTGMAYANGHNFTQTLNARLLPQRLLSTKGSIKALDKTYGYDARGKVTSMVDGAVSGNNRTYGYDGLGRLTSATGPWGTGSFKYDSLDNLRQKKLGSRTVNLSYDSRNRLSKSADTGPSGTRTVAYDAQGNVTTLGNLGFLYDYSDQPVVVSGTANGVGAANGSYTYDGNMKRVKSVVNGKTIYNVYDASGSLVHIHDFGRNQVTDYVSGPNGPLAKITNNVVTYLHKDHLGSPVAGTGSTGGIAFRETFTPFGITLTNAASTDDHMGFTGHIKDKATGLNYMQARYYDPVIGRFLSVDPVTFLQSGDPRHFNRYAYSFNDPVNMFDPDGRDPMFAMDLEAARSGPMSQAEINMRVQAGKDFGAAVYDFFIADGVAAFQSAANGDFKAAGAAAAMAGIKPAKAFDTIKDVKKAVNSNLGHASERAVERAGFDNVKDASSALKGLSKDISKNGFPKGSVVDPKKADRVRVPFGEGSAVFQVGKNGTAKLKTVLPEEKLK